MKNRTRAHHEGLPGFERKKPKKVRTKKEEGPVVLAELLTEGSRERVRDKDGARVRLLGG